MRILNTEKCSPQHWLICAARDEIEEATEKFYVAIKNYEDFIARCPKVEYHSRFFQDREYEYRKEIDRQAMRIHDLEKLIAEHDRLGARPRWKELDEK